MNKEAKNILFKTIESAGEWERLSTSVEGLYVVKPPEHNNKQIVYIELIPIVQGQPSKKKGLFIKSESELESFQELINNPKTKELLEAINEYYGVQKTPKIEI